MARIRSIKPEFPQSESIGRISRDARLLFVLLFTIVDDCGRTRAASRLLASLLYPYDGDAAGLIERWLAELEREGCIVRYEVNGSHYLEICKWLTHQKIDHPSPSKLPSPREGSRILATVSETLAPDLDWIGLDRSNTPPTPSFALNEVSGPPPKKRRRKSAEVIASFSPSVAEVVNALAGRWPRKRPGNGSLIQIDIPLFASRVDEIMVTHNLSPAEVIEIADLYLQQDKEFPNAPQFFFGRGSNGNGPPWMNYARMVRYEREKAHAEVAH